MIPTLKDFGGNHENYIHEDGFEEAYNKREAEVLDKEI